MNPTDPQKAAPLLVSRPATCRDCIDAGEQRLQAAGCDAPRQSALWLLQDATGSTPTQMYRDLDAVVPPDAVSTFEAAIERRAQGEPLQHILGYTEFYGLKIRVSPDVLVPRPETEEVVEYALKKLSGIPEPRVLDVGTGSGCIALAVKHTRPEARVRACDVSDAACEIARGNASALDLSIDVSAADMLSPGFPDAVGGPYELVISNPPYIPDEEAETLSDTVREYDPPLALFAGQDPLRFYIALAHSAPDVLVPGGYLIVETHADFSDGVSRVFEGGGFEEVEVQTDLSGRPRIVCGVRAASA